MSKNNMFTRLKFAGGANQIDRMNKDKLKSLKKAILYSYQSATIQLPDGREFKCLINPNKLSMDLDNKILSIPFKAICLNKYCLNNSNNKNLNKTIHENMDNSFATLTLIDSNLLEEIEKNKQEVENSFPISDIKCNDTEEVLTKIKEGDTIYWKENCSYWIIYLRRLEETAYFRAEMRRCRYQLVLGNGSKYWAYVKGPVEQNILWTQTSGNYFNKLNYSLVMYITQNSETLNYFHRFKKVMINNKIWEVQAVDNISTPGILEVSLKETYTNTIETNIDKIIKELNEDILIQPEETIKPYIYGSIETYPYEVYHYDIKNCDNGVWIILDESRKNLVELKNIFEHSVDLYITTGKSGSFTLAYKVDNEIKATLNVVIRSL